MIPRLRLLTVFALSLTLGAFTSGSAQDAAPELVQPSAPLRGTLIQAPPALTASLTASNVLDALTAFPQAERVLDLISRPRCGIDIYHLQYNTIDPLGTPITASAALMVPTGNAERCQGPRPIVVYTHGTEVRRTLNQAEITNEDNQEALLAAAAFTAQGYVLVAPNYAGFDISTLPYHPYLNAEQQANDAIDALRAARGALLMNTVPTISDNGHLFITGYSQGGYVAMATHRLLQEMGEWVSASAPMSGPYAMAAFGDAVFYGQVTRTLPLFLTYTVVGYQRAYGNIYGSPTELFEPRYAADIETLLPSVVPRSQLFAEGKLPRQQVFSSEPPDPSYAPLTPATWPRDLAHVFAGGFGPENLVTNSFRAAYLQDAFAHPDGGFPEVTDGLPPAAPTNTLRLALKANDLRNWVPTSPVLLCGGNEDPTVLYMNTRLMDNYWRANGVATEIRVLDLDGSLSWDDRYLSRKLAFKAAKVAVRAAAVAGGADDRGREAVTEEYHSTLVPPFCVSAAKQFFDRNF